MAENKEYMCAEDEYSKDPAMCFCRLVIRHAVRVLAVLMTLVILWGVGDVLLVLYRDLTDAETPFLLSINEILETFAAFMAVLIAIEIFQNITIYLRDDIIHVKIVMATALMAVARKVIVLDFDKLESSQVFALAAVMLAMGVGYWLVAVYDRRKFIYGTLPRKQGTE